MPVDREHSRRPDPSLDERTDLLPSRWTPGRVALVGGGAVTLVTLASLSGILSPKPHAESAGGYTPALATSLNNTTELGSSFLAIENARAQQDVLEKQVCNPIVEALRARLDDPGMTRTPLTGDPTRFAYQFSQGNDDTGADVTQLTAYGDEHLSAETATGVWANVVVVTDQDNWKLNKENLSVSCTKLDNGGLKVSGIYFGYTYDSGDPAQGHAATQTATDATQLILNSLQPVS